MLASKNIYYIHFDTVDSTNTWAKKNAHTLDRDHITCITSLEQTAGRGRFERSWLSPKGQNIYASLFFGVHQNFKALANLGQVLSLSCATVLLHNGFNAKIKWPNDLLLEGKKVAGVLTEIVHMPDYTGVVLGIGINVNMTDDLLNTIEKPATSLAQLSGQTWNLEQILEPLLQQFLKDLELLQTQGFLPFREYYESLLTHKGRPITCVDGEKTYKGIAHSINDEGKLNLLLFTGQIVTLSAGDLKL